jgi:NAD(P)-dependent dehydrogenase (short-subunit alcohol dehydrogenase family)
MDLRGKRALVTGGAIRLGRAIALDLARAGVHVAVHYRGSAEAAAETARDCAQLTAATLADPAPAEPTPRTPPTPPTPPPSGADAIREPLALGADAIREPLALGADAIREPLALGADLTRPAEVDALFARLADAWGGVHLLVNSVGLHARTPVARLDADALEAAFDSQLDVNLRVAARCLHRARPRMLALGGGAAVNLTDALLRRPFPGFGPYHAAKVALEALTRTWAVELAPGIRVNAVAPGIVLPADTDSAESRARWLGRIPLGRLGTPEELAEAVRFLLAADYVTGQVLAVDGGLSWAR